MACSGKLAHLDGIDEQHKAQGPDCGDPGGGGQARDELQEGYEQKVHVGHSCELLEQVDWQEAEKGVLCCSDAVAWKAQRIQQAQLGAK